jgi:hypothetical protein
LEAFKMANKLNITQMQSLFMQSLANNLDDVLNRPETPLLVTELQKKLPKVNAQTLEICIATAFSILDVIDENNEPTSKHI